MKIENPSQAEAVQSWIEKCTQQLITLDRRARITGDSQEDGIKICKRLQESLEASLINYSEDKNYGNPTKEKPPTGQEPLREQSGSSPTQPEGDNPAGQGKDNPKKTTEVENVLLSDNPPPKRKGKKGNLVKKLIGGGS